MFKLGYNTNGFASHSLLSAVDIIGSLGYESVAITVDHHSLNPWDKSIKSNIGQVKAKLDAFDLSSILETGARFLLNPNQKHEPTLVSSGSRNRAFRVSFIEKCLDIAVLLEAEAVSIWSGIRQEDVESEQAWEWLVEGCRKVSEAASNRGIVIAFEPEPGMLVENLSQFDRLKARVDHDAFKLTLDLGHAFITEEDVCCSIRQYQSDIVNIHLEDMKKQIHDHLFFGEGEMDFKEIFKTLDEIHYSGQVNIELSRHSHNAVEIARRAKAFHDRLNSPR